jgi:HD-like signal output (HDOD) protein
MNEKSVYTVKDFACKYDIRGCIRDIRRISSISVSLSKIFEITRDENSSIDDIADAIRHDQAVASRVLAMANSPYFGHPHMINSIEQAILTLGIDVVKSIVLSVTVFDSAIMPKYKLKDLWAHSYVVGLLSGHLSYKVPMQNEGVCFLAGLLHDVGRIILSMVRTEDYYRILELPEKNLAEREYDIFWCDHAEAGGLFIKRLYLPEEIIMPLFSHHDMEILSVIEKHRKVSEIVFIAEGLTDLIIPEFSSDGLWTDNHEILFRMLGFDENDKNDLRFYIQDKKEHIANFFNFLY